MAKKRTTPKQQQAAPRPLTAQDEAFVQAILEEPEDDTPRLIYADWLQDQGEEDRAEFIRGQIALARMPEKGPGRNKLQKRVDKILEAHREEWLRPLTQGAHHYVYFRRGFPDSAGAPFADFCYWEESLWKYAPVAYVALSSPWPFDANWGGMFDSDEEARDAHHRAFREVAANPNLAHVCSLEIYECLGDRDMEALAASPHLRRMRALRFGYNAIGNAGARALARCRHLTTLRHLDLSSNHITSEGARALARSRHLDNLVTLDLRQNHFNDVAIAALRDRFGQRVQL
jgi:uncharacterized protein (TIGR02996 family)